MFNKKNLLVVWLALGFAGLGFFTWMTQGVTTQALFYLLGHLSFAINFLAYAQKSIIRLRLVAIMSLSVGLVYNGYVHINMPEGQGLWPVLIWLSIFLIQNTFCAIMEVKGSIEVSLSTREKILIAKAFPAMHSRDWLSILAISEKMVCMKGETILHLGDKTDALYVVCSGQVTESRPDMDRQIINNVGAMWGEITYSVGESDYNHSPCDIVAHSDEVEVLKFNYEKLRALEEKNQRLKAALRDGFFRSVSFKHGVLHEDPPQVAMS